MPNQTKGGPCCVYAGRPLFAERALMKTSHRVADVFHISTTHFYMVMVVGGKKGVAGVASAQNSTWTAAEGSEGAKSPRASITATFYRRVWKNK